MTRNEARETLMQILFELDTSKAFEEEDALRRGVEIISDRMSGGHIARCSVLLENIVGSLPEIDAEINKYSTNPCVPIQPCSSKSLSKNIQRDKR